MHVGTTDGKLEAELAASGRLLVHGVSLEADQVAAARKALQAEGVGCDVIRYGWLHKAPLFAEGSPYNEDCLGRCPLVKTPSDFATAPLPVTEYLYEHSFMIAPRFENECQELIDQYIEAYHKVTSSVDELLALEKDQ